MNKTITIEIKNKKALKLLKMLEELELISVLRGKSKRSENVSAEKYWAILTKEEGENLNTHIQKSRDEWGTT